MERVRIGLITLDMRFARRVRRSAERIGVEVVHVSKIEELPLMIRAAVAKRGEVKSSDPRILYLEDHESEDELVEKALEVSLGVKEYRVAAVAIDPGKNMGAAYIIDGRILRTKRYRLLESLILDVRRFLKSHSNAYSKYVLIGSTRGLDVSDKIMDEIQRQFYGEDVRVLRVDESGTSRGFLPREKGMSRDEYAALILILKNFFRLG